MEIQRSIDFLRLIYIKDSLTASNIETTGKGLPRDKEKTKGISRKSRYFH